MKNDYARAAGLGALALALSTAGCGGGTPMSATPPANPSVIGARSAPGFALPERRHHHGFCAVVTNSQNFNGTAIARGSWIWFSSVTSFPGNNGNVRVQMRDSKITFSSGTKRYKIAGPSMHLSLAGSTVKLRFKSFGIFGSHKGTWTLRAPVNTAGNDLLGTVAYRVTRSLPGGISNVTWSGKFYSKSAVKSMHWQWGAAVYTRFSKSNKRLGVKPLDDNHYPPYNSDHAGTPERFKQFVTGGATGGGGSNYTGGLSGTVNVTPCK